MKLTERDVMALKRILTTPHPVLARKAAEVANIDQKIVALAKDMAETMYQAPGIGLAANQVGELIRLVVLDVVYAYADPKHKRKDPLILINPEIDGHEGEVILEEGCLSVPELTVEVLRWSAVAVKGVDIHGNPVSLEADGLLARALQHEIDHLDGATILDRASALKRNLYLRRMKKKTKRED
jgi:peptide deformylase